MAHFTATQLAKALAPLDTQLAGIQAALDSLKLTWGVSPDVPEIVADAWNHLHDAHDALSEHRARVALNPRPIPAAEQGTWALVQANID